MNKFLLSSSVPRVGYKVIIFCVCALSAAGSSAFPVLVFLSP